MPKYNALPINSVLNFLKQKQTFILLESSLPDKENHLSYVFTDPLTIIRANSFNQIKTCFKQISQAKQSGHYVSGFISYEAGYIISDKFKKLHIPAPDLPLIWMGVFKNPLIFDHQKNMFTAAQPDLSCNNKLTDFGDYKLKNMRLDISRADYLKKIKQIKHLIESGDTYQVNYTTKYKFDFQGSAFAMYRRLRDNQSIPYGAFIKSPEFDMLSFSPELFYCQNKNFLTVKPMKGTAVRGINLSDDAKNKKSLCSNIKNQAENLMIVDLLRNDLGRISQTGSVKVNRLFRVETYKTLLQMTSTISSKLKPKTSLLDIFISLFPSGSVTGAPKIRTMEIIDQLEKEPRKIYTGAIGFFAPQDNAVFNVAIRTILLKDNKGEMGIGSGITYSSDPAEEYNECKLKARFLTLPDFKLIETILWRKDKNFPFLEYHLNRLKQSAVFFKYSYSKKLILQKLDRLSAGLDPGYDHKVRLLLARSGEVRLEAKAIFKDKSDLIPKIKLSKTRVDSKDIFLYHKTTNRGLYNREFKKYKQQGFFDVIFQNKNNQITEGAISNIFIRKKGVYYTPGLKCGLLPGVFRTFFMKHAPDDVREKTLYLEDLKNADAIYCGNAVKGLVKVKLKNN